MLPEKLSLEQDKKKNHFVSESQSVTNEENHQHTVKQVVLLGIFFLLLTLTYSSFSTIITFIYENHGGLQYLGPLLLITNYGTFMIVNIFAPFITISYKKQLIIGAICYTINYAIQVPVILSPFGIFLLIFGSILGGFGAAIVWVSQGGFMMALFEKYRIPADHHGKYFGLLNMLIFSNILLGSIVSTFGLGFFGDTEYFIILTAIGGISVFFGIFLLQGTQNKILTYLQFNDEEQEKNFNRKNRPKQLSSVQSQKSTKWLFFSPEMNIMNSISSIYRFLTKMKYFIPMIITDGCILGFISASVTHFLPSDHYEKIQVGIFLIFLGVGAILGGYISGFFSDKFPIMKVGKSSFFVLGICMFLSLPIFLQMANNVFYSNFLGFLWGFGWHYMDGWLWVTCSKIFGGKLQAFALNKFIHSFSFVLYQVALIFYGEKKSRQFIEYFFCVLLILMTLALISIIEQEKKYIRTLNS